MGFMAAAMSTLATGGLNMFLAKKAQGTIGIGPLFQRISGGEALKSAEVEAQLMGTQSNLAIEESLREAARVDRQTRAFQEEQAATFAKRGSLAGSPLGILTETQALRTQEVDAIRRAGEAQATLNNQRALQVLRAGYTARFTSEASALAEEFQFKQNKKLASLRALTGAGDAVTGAAMLGGYGGFKMPSFGFGAASNFWNAPRAGAGLFSKFTPRMVP